MLEGQRMVLECRVAVGLGQMAGVARLGEQAQIGQAQVIHQSAVFLDGWNLLWICRATFGKRGNEGCAEDGKNREGPIGGPQSAQMCS